MVEIPPGFVWIARRLPVALTTVTVGYVLHRLLRNAIGAEIPLWLTILLLPLLPLSVIVRDRISQFIKQRRARSFGAVLAPIIHSDAPAGFSVLSALIENLTTGYVAEIHRRWAEEYGHLFNMKTLYEDRLFTTEPEHIKMILSTKFDYFEKGKTFRAQVKPLFGTGVFNSDGDLWKFHRSMTRPFFVRDRISDFDNFETHAMDAISQMKARLRKGYPVDFQDVVSRFTMDSATKFLFGKDVCSLSAGLPYPQRSAAYPDSPVHLNSASHWANVFSQHFLDAQVQISRRGRLGLNWPLGEFWKDEAKPHTAAVQSYLKPILEDALRKKEGRADVDPEKVRREVREGETLLDYLVTYTEDTTILQDEIMNILLAGRDTTASVLTFTVYLLAQYPDVLKRLREEILSMVGPSGNPTSDSFKNMKILRAVINESLRLYPPVPFNIRSTSKDTILPPCNPGEKPFYVPANTKMLYSVLAMHRRTDLWGPDASEFDPDRFLDERLNNYLTPNPFIFLPFNAGPRICLGQQFAYNEMSYMLVRLFQTFSEVSLDLDAQPPASLAPPEWAASPGRMGIEKIRPKVHVTMCMTGGLWIKMNEAEAT